MFEATRSLEVVVGSSLSYSATALGKANGC